MERIKVIHKLKFLRDFKKFLSEILTKESIREEKRGHALGKSLLVSYTYDIKREREDIFLKTKGNLIYYILDIGSVQELKVPYIPLILSFLELSTAYPQETYG